MAGSSVSRAVLPVIAAGAWIGTVIWARRTGNGPGTMGLGLLPFVGMWALMMTAMMLPAVTGSAASGRSDLPGSPDGQQRHRAGSVLAFGFGYLLVWAATGLPAFGLATGVGSLAGHHPDIAIGAAAAIFAAGRPLPVHAGQASQPGALSTVGHSDLRPCRAARGPGVRRLVSCLLVGGRGTDDRLRGDEHRRHGRVGRGGVRRAPMVDRRRLSAPGWRRIARRRRAGGGMAVPGRRDPSNAQHVAVRSRGATRRFSLMGRAGSYSYRRIPAGRFESGSSAG